LGFENRNSKLVGAGRKSHLERKGNWETGNLKLVQAKLPFSFLLKEKLYPKL